MKYALKIYAICIFTILTVTSLYSRQLEDTSKVDSTNKIFISQIIITGNDVTDKRVILREMVNQEGKPLNVEQLQYDLENIYNTGLFTKIDVTPVPVGEDSLTLLIDVEESFYILPIPQGGIKEGDLNKIWGGVNLKWRNFRGLNETLGLSFGIGYEPFIRASYSNPWISSNKYFMSLSGGYARRNIQDIYSYPPGTIIDKDTVERYGTTNIDLSASVGKYVTNNLALSIGLSFHRLHVSDYQLGRTLSPNGTDDYPTASFNADLDSRDLFSYPSNGAFGSLELIKFGFANDYINFNRSKVDFRKYIPIIPFDGYTIIFATRVLNVISWGGNIPPYLKEQFGYGETIRGWGEKVFEGDNLLGGFAEFRFPIIKPAYIEGKDLPLIKKISFLKGISYKYGLYITTFFDIGGVWDKDENFFDTQFRRGFGMGLNVILPFDFVGRMDVSLSKKTSEFSFDLDFGLSAAF